MNKDRTFGWTRGIGTRVLLVGTLPLITLALVLGFSLVGDRLETQRAALTERGQIISLNLALATEYPLFTGDEEGLRQIVSLTAEAHPEIAEIFVLDADRKTVVEHRTEQPDSPSGWWAKHQEAKTIDFEMPIGRTGPVTEDFGESLFPAQTASAPTVLGWVKVCLAPREHLQREQAMLQRSLLLILLGLAVSILIALMIGRTITHPMARLLGAVDRLRHGDMDARIERLSSGEIGELEQGFNAMALAIDSSHTELTRQVREATDALEQTIGKLRKRNEQLSVAEEEASAAGQAKQEFLARMSHEIRTPLNAVIGFSRLLEKAPSGPREKEYIRTINLASTQLLAVIDDILQFTRLESGTLELECLPFNLPDSVEDVVTLISSQAQEKHIELICHIHSDLPTRVVGDPARFSQILLNLLNNAVKFTEEGHVLVEASFTPEHPGEGTVRICVTDTGSGIPESSTPQLFKPFSQADRTVARRYGGSGLGLAIAARLASLMKGHLGYTSTEGKGSTFWLELPVTDIAAEPADASPAPFAGFKVLIYDRHPLSRKTLRANLARLGFDIFNTGSLDTLFKKLSTLNATEGEKKHLVVIGLAPDEYQTDAALSIFRTVRQWFSGPMILLPGSSECTAPPAIEQDPLTACVVKPIRRSTLLDSLSRLFGLQDLPEEECRAAGSTPKQASRKRALYVEDNQFNQRLLTLMLERHGIMPDLADSGEAALKMIGRKSYDLIFMDLHMPGMDGTEAASRIRLRLGTACPPIVALTADVFADPVDTSHNGIFDDHLLKPVSETALMQTLEQWIPPMKPVGDSEQLRRRPPAKGPAIALSADLRQGLYSEIDRLIQELSNAAETSDYETLSEVTHQLKGLSGVYEMTEIGSQVRELEAAIARRDKQSEIAALINTIDSLSRTS